MSCQIKRDNNNNIIEVLAPNGKPSILYDTLKSKLNNFKFKQVVVMDDYVSLVVNSEYIQNKNNEELALAAWSKAYTKEFINSFGDWKTKKLPNTDINNEPDVDSLFDVRTVIEENLTAETVRELSYMMQGKTDTNYKLINDKDRLFISRIEDSQVIVNIANVTPNTNVYDVFGRVVLASVKKNNPTLYNNLIDVTKTNQKVKSKDYRYKLSKGEFHITSDKNQAARAQKNLDYVLGKTTEKPPYISGIGYLRFKDGELYTYKSALNLEYDRSGIKLDIKETTNKLQSIIDEAEERYLYSDNISATIQEESMLELLNLYNSNQLEDKAEIRLAKELLKEVKSFIQKILPQKDLNQLPENLTVNDITGLLFQNNPVKPGVEFVFEQNPELKTIGTQEQYSQYLDTVFPNSKVKDIVYHGTVGTWFKKEKFALDKGSKKTTNKSNQYGYWFGENKQVATIFNSVDLKSLASDLKTNVKLFEEKLNIIQETYKISDDEIDIIVQKTIEYMKASSTDYSKQFHKPSTSNTISVIINAVNPDRVDTLRFAGSTRGDGQNALDYLNTFKGDSLIFEQVEDAGPGGEEFEFGKNYAVKTSEQIHILGSNSDIQQFKQYVQTSSGKNWTNVKNNCPKL